MDFRTEHDSLWEKQIPIDALYGIQSLRAEENFPISGQTLLPEMVRAYAIVKKSAAQVNMWLGKLDEKIAKDIEAVCDEILDGQHAEHFIVDVFQAGAGTSTNMNINEVIANRILEMRGESKGSYDIASPNDHVNMSQSTNDTYPTAMRIALVLASEKFVQQLEILIESFQKKADEFTDVLTSARTHLQDAVPITLGQEFQGYTNTLKALLQRYRSSIDELRVLGIWGSAAGTGINTHEKYHTLMIAAISSNSVQSFYQCSDLIESMQSQRQIGEYMWTLSQIATEVSRIANDLRLLSSWPHTGISEIILPPVQPGSSIMPGKVNPSILECVNMVCFRVGGANNSVRQCLEGGQLNLNVFMPLMSLESLTATSIMGNTCVMMAEKCIYGIGANTKMTEKYAYESNGLFTALNPILGYQRVSDLVKKKEKTGKSVKELLLESWDMTEEEIDEILDPKKLTGI